MSTHRPLAGWTTADCSRNRLFLLGRGGLLIALAILVGLGGSDAWAQSAPGAGWEISSTSSVTIIGSKRFLANQNLDLAGGSPPDGWVTTEYMSFPQIGLGFGTYVDVTQIGPADGIQLPSGEMSLDLPLRVRDSDGASVDIVAHLTTEQTAGSDGAVQLCPGILSVCEGSRRDPLTGQVRMVAIVELPPQGATFVSGRALLIEVEGSVPFGDSDGDGIDDILDNCPLVANPLQEDADLDGIGDACEDDSGGGGTPVADGFWNIYLASNLRLIGFQETLDSQQPAIARVAPYDWATLHNIVFPRIHLPFGEFIDVAQNGEAGGTLDSQTGEITLDLPLIVTDNYGGTGAFTAHLTTEQTNGVEEGDPVCNGGPSDPSTCEGTRRDLLTGEFRLVAITTVPGTIVVGKLLHLELTGMIDASDTDEDGIEDFSDNCPEVPNASQYDGDADGRGDACDVCPLDSDPGQQDYDSDGMGDACDADDDDDGVADLVDNCPLAANPDQTDSDGDGPGDACDTDSDNDGLNNTADNCPNVFNPTQANDDGDALGDLCDACPFDAGNDVDDDGVCGDQDNCIAVANAAQTDADLDGFGDACDICPFHVANDNDSDGVCEDVDNCLGLANANQADGDSDGLGDACDNCPGDPLNDDDADGLCGYADNCPDLANPGQEDRDQDGLGDYCDPLRVNFAPPSSANPAGYRHDMGSGYDPDEGFGWEAPILTRERMQLSALELDTFAFTQGLRRWTAELPNGEYDVRVVTGDASYAQGPHRVQAQDVLVIDDALTTGGEFADATGRVLVRNGLLDLWVGGSTGLTMVNWVEAVEVPSASETPVSVNFQPADSATPEGYLADSGLVFDEARGYGWTGAMPVRDRAKAVPQVRDTLVYSGQPRVWEIQLDNGVYEIWFSIGDAQWSQGPHRVRLEGSTWVNGAVTSGGQFLEHNGLVQVTDGRLSVEIGGAGGITTLNQIVIAAAGEDVDGDGVPNHTDNCALVANPGQVDGDGDGLGDACDPDLDQDGVADDQDNCPGLANPDQDDRDADGLGDLCDPDDDNDGASDGADNCPGEPNPGQSDQDSDGPGDACDNCPGQPNAGQSDTDDDGLGDVCDSCPDDAMNDDDGDGICGAADNCPDLANPGQEDRDADGLGDVCDPLKVNFSPSATSVPAGFMKDTGSIFDGAQGYGWNVSVPTRDRQSGAAVELDSFAFTFVERMWAIELPNGDYDVRIVSGDSSFAQGPHRIVAGETTVFADVTTEAAGFVESTIRVPVRNGRLELRAGGAGGWTMLNLVEAQELPQTLEAMVSVNFQPGGSPVPEGYLVDAGQPFDAERGYGWDAPVLARDRGMNLPQVLDTLVFSVAPATWELELADGIYEVWLSVGDVLYAQGAHRVRVEGVSVVEDENTAAGQFLERKVLVEVNDGALSVEIGGGGGMTTLNQLVLAPPATDADGDGLDNDIDNCPVVVNPNQLDADGDGRGDACDLCTDNDGDGYGDAGFPGNSCPPDNCPEQFNAGQLDDDGDGLGNVCDPLIINFAPLSADPVAGYLTDSGTLFDVVQGFGWDESPFTRERASDAATEYRTFAFSHAERVWTIELPDGDYRIRVVSGDASYAQGPHRVVIGEKLLIDGLATGAGEFVEGSAEVTVSGGTLSLTIGGSAGYTMLNLVEIAEASE